jgi:hypothetical protein
VERYAVLDDVALADCAVEIEGRDTDDLFETAGMAVRWWTSTRWKSSGKFISLTLSATSRAEVRDEDYPPD